MENSPKFRRMAMSNRPQAPSLNERYYARDVSPGYVAAVLFRRGYRVMVSRVRNRNVFPPLTGLSRRGKCTIPVVCIGTGAMSWQRVSLGPGRSVVASDLPPDELQRMKLARLRYSNERILQKREKIDRWKRQMEG